MAPQLCGCSLRILSMVMLVALLLLLHHDVALATTSAPAATVSTVAASASLNSPIDVTVDAAGTLLIVSFGSHTVQRVLASGAVDLVAGSAAGQSGTSDGTGTSARFYQPYGIACDTALNVAYICDTGNKLIRTLAISSASVTTLAGGGITGSDNGVGAAARFNYPVGIVCAPGGILYVCDWINNAVRKIVVATATVSTVALVTECWYLCLSRSGTTLYVTTWSAIARVDIPLGTVVTMAGSNAASFADGGPTVARFNIPSGIALNGDETALLISDSSNNRIRRLDLSTGFVTTIAGSGASGTGNGAGLNASFKGPYGARWHCSNTMMRCGLLLADSGNNAVRFAAVEVPRSATKKATSPATRTAASASASSSSVLTHTQSISTSSSRTASTSSSWTSGTASATRLATTVSHCDSGSTSDSRVATLGSLSFTDSRTRRCALVVEGGRRSVGVLQQVTRGHATPIAGATVVGDANSTTSESVVATPVPRQKLLTNAPLAANLSVVLAGGSYTALDAWQLVGVRLDVVAEGVAMPLLTANVVPFTVLSTDVVGHDQHLVLLVQPPNGTGFGRWLPSTLGVFRAVTLRLELTLRCPASPTVTHAVVVEVPSPGQPQELASAVRSTVTASQYASWASVPSAGSAVGRAAALRGLVLCSSGGSVDGLLPLPAGAAACDDADSPSDVADARGAVLGNLALWAAGCVLMGVAVCVYAHRLSTSLVSAVESLGVPSPVLPLVVATVPSTIAGTFVLLRSSCAADVVVAAVGVGMCAALLGVIVAFAFMVPSQLFLQPITMVSTDSVETNHFAHLRTFVRGLLRRRVRWVAAGVATRDVLSGGRRTVRLERVGTVVVLEYAAVWYLCVDVAVLTSASVLGSVGVLEVAPACEGAAVCVALLYVGQLVLCTVVRPFTTLFSHVHALFLLTLSTVSVCCRASYLLASRRDGADLGALDSLLTASAVCDLVVAVMGMLRTFVDGVGAARACMRHVVAMQQSRGGGSDAPAVFAGGPVPSFGGALCLSPTAPLGLARMIAEDTVSEVVLGDLGGGIDGSFWRDDGTAATLQVVGCDVRSPGGDLLAYFDSVGGAINKE